MKARRMFYEGLASMLGAGMPIRTALEHGTSLARGAFGEALSHLQAEVGKGRALADAMEDRPGSFPRVHAETVRAAEASGTLDRALRALAAEEETAERRRGEVLARIAYPMFVLHFTAIPLNVTRLVEGKILAFVGGCLLVWLPIWLAVGAVALLVRRARTGGAAARLLLGVPWIGGILRDAAYVRWARVYAALDDAGLPADRAAERAAAATGYSILEERLASPAPLLRAGVSRAEAFRTADLPADFYQMLVTGEASGEIAKSLSRAADLREQAARTRTDALVAMLPAVMTILVGAVVLWIAIGFYSSRLQLPR